MANLFVLYIPVEDVDDEEISDDSKRRESLKKDQKLFANQQIREVVSTPDIAKIFSPFKEKKEPRKPAAEQNEEGYFESSERHPLLGPGEVVGRFVKSQSSTSINKLHKEKKFSDASSNQQPSLTSINEKNFKEVPGSRFKISEVSADSPDGEVGVVEGEDVGVEEGEDDVCQEVMTLREFLEDKLTGKMKVNNYLWQKTNDEAHWMVTFMVSKERCDYVYNFLTSCGLGWIPETSISVFPTSVHKEGTVGEKNSDVTIKSKFNAEKTEFLKSIKASLTVAQVVGDIGNNAKLTFDFLLLIFLASMIAGFGLAENSSVVLVASMLISPLMGPIIGFTFGMVIKNWQLCRLSFRTEIIGLSICLVYGFFFGLITAGIEATSLNYTSDAVWPTVEMTSRGMLRSLWVGVFIALPSGAGVALAILGGNTGSLVGVAISASLLPPVVNAGMFWGLAVITAIYTPQTLPIKQITEFSTPASNYTTTLKPPHCLPLYDNAYKFTYSCEMWRESLVMGCLSLLLAILNIVCIFIMGTLVMKIKEISPLPGATKQSASFWKKDLNFYRNAYQTIKGDKSTDMGNMAKTLTSLIKANPKADVREVISTVKDDQFFRTLSDPNLLDSLMEMKDPPRLNLPVEFKFNDNRYHTVGGHMTEVEQVPLASIFQGMGDPPTTTTTAAGGAPLTPAITMPLNSKTVATPLKAGGCVLRLRRNQSRIKASRHTAHVVTGQKKVSNYDEDVFRVKFEPTVEEEEEEEEDEEEEEEEEEVLVMDLDWLASHQRKSRFQKKKTISIGI